MITWPFRLVCSLTINVTMGATNSGLMVRMNSSGMFPCRAVIGVAAYGAIAFVRTLCDLPSAASVRMKPIRAAFDAE